MADNKDYIVCPEESGSINISEEVIASIAALTTAEIEGVSGFTAGLGKDIAELLGKKNITRGIRIEPREDGIVVEALITVHYGFAVVDVAKAVQEKVSAAIESTTGLKVLAVNVRVSGISFDKDKDKK